VSRLSSFREGQGGLILFYAYLIAILIVAVMVVRALDGLHKQANTIKATVHRLDEQGDRSCRAIAGALVYWRGERQINLLVLRDPSSTVGQRDRARSRVDNLNKLLASGDKIDCGADGA
jgi:hypothetical protein